MGYFGYVRSSPLARLVYEIKARTGCCVCPERNPVTIDFHHLNPAEKKFGIAVG